MDHRRLERLYGIRFVIHAMIRNSGTDVRRLVGLVYPHARGVSVVGCREVSKASKKAMAQRMATRRQLRRESEVLYRAAHVQGCDAELAAPFE